MSGSLEIVGRMMGGPHLHLASRRDIAPGTVLSVLLCAGFGSIPPANAQTSGSSYSSTASKDCRVVSAGNGVEWRTLDGKPFAIIQRRHIADNADEDKNGRPISKPLLAVTRLPPGAVCHVAYVDVKANPNANELARGFMSGKDEVKVIGASGRAVELATGH
jgi:hypothetical protein